MNGPMANHSEHVTSRRRSLFQFRVSAFQLGILAIVFIGLTSSSDATTRFAKQSEKPTGSTSLSSMSPSAGKAATIVGKIPTCSALPAGATSAALAPGATQLSLTFPSTGQDAASTSSPTDLAVAVHKRAVMQTPSGFIATAPLNGLPGGSYVIVHSDGSVSANSATGDVIWNHASLEFTQWTGRYPTLKSGAEPTPLTPIVSLGFDPIDPFSEQPFAVGDLNGDGVDDIAIAHYFTAVAAIDGYNGGNGVRNGGTFVSVLDGRTGNLVWSYMYPGSVHNLAIENGMLIVGSETGDVRGFLGQNRSVSTLDGWNFTGALPANPSWSISTGAQWATWLALEELPNGKIAAAWTNSAPGSGNATNATELVVSLATGGTDWSVATSGYPRYLRFDSTRNQVVAIEEADPTTTYAYSIIARNLADGSVAIIVAENNATALNFQVGDLDGDGLAEWVVADISFLPCTPVTCVGVENSGRVLAINGSTGAQEWTQVRSSQLIDPSNPLAGSDIPRPYGLLLTPTSSGADVVVGTFIPGGNMELERLNGALNLSGPGGTILWSKSAPNLFLPLFMSLYQQNAGSFVRVASSRDRVYGISQQIDQLGTTIRWDGREPFQIVRSFDLANGNEVSTVPLLGRIHAAAGADVNGDGTSDIIIGGESGAVFALDGTQINNHPVVLWRETVAGPVHQIAAADLNGDGHIEIVVAATSAIDVLDSVTGNLRYEIPYTTDYIWNFALADLNGDGKIDIVVPGAASIIAYSGPTGSALWTYTPSGLQAQGTLFSNVGITPGNIVTAQFAYGMQTPGGTTGSGFNRGFVALNGATGAVLWSNTTLNAWPQFWHGTVAGNLDGLSGSVVGFTWTNQAQSVFTLGMEIRDAATGNVINSLPTPSTYNSSYGTVLSSKNGIVSYVGNDSWLLTPTQSGSALGSDSPFDMIEGNFGILGKRVLEGGLGGAFDVFPQSGIAFVPSYTSPAAHAAGFSDAIAPYRVYVQDLDHTGSTEVIRTQWDWDGYVALVENIEGFGYEVTGLSDGLDILDVSPVPVQLNSVVSRMSHGSAGSFDVNLPLTGNPGIECRSGGANGEYTLVFTFANTLSSVGSASVTNGAGSVATSNIDITDAHNYSVNLTGVSDAQVITVSLSNVIDSTGSSSAAVEGSMAILIGDTNGDGFVNSADISQAKSQSGTVVTSANFREDVNADGFLNSADISLVKSESGTALP